MGEDEDRSGQSGRAEAFYAFLDDPAIDPALKRALGNLNVIFSEAIEDVAESVDAYREWMSELTLARLEQAVFAESRAEVDAFLLLNKPALLALSEEAADAAVERLMAAIRGCYAESLAVMLDCDALPRASSEDEARLRAEVRKSAD